MRPLSLTCHQAASIGGSAHHAVLPGIGRRTFVLYARACMGGYVHACMHTHCCKHTGGVLGIRAASCHGIWQAVSLQIRAGTRGKHAKLLRDTGTYSGCAVMVSNEVRCEFVRPVRLDISDTLSASPPGEKPLFWRTVSAAVAAEGDASVTEGGGGPSGVPAKETFCCLVTVTDPGVCPEGMGLAERRIDAEKLSPVGRRA